MTEDNATKLRSSYDTLASQYASRIYDELRNKPFDRAILDRFAARVRDAGLVCDLGCGPAQIARYLAGQNCRSFGLDLSHGMLLEARRLNADIEFVEGSMLWLPVTSGSLAGIAAFYSVIHLTREQLPVASAEFARALRPGGRMLLAFHLGVTSERTTELWGHKVDFNVTLLETSEVCETLQSAGFAIEDAQERAPYAPDVEYQSHRGYILAVKVAP
jgi:SAM-dependent methyltransferase